MHGLGSGINFANHEHAITPNSADAVAYSGDSFLGGFHAPSLAPIDTPVDFELHHYRSVIRVDFTIELRVRSRRLRNFNNRLATIGPQFRMVSFAGSEASIYENIW